MHGASFIDHHLHIATDFPVLPRPCVPNLAAVLALEQSRSVRAAMDAAMPIGLSVAPASDVFVPMGEQLHGAPVYRGVHNGEVLYRCESSAQLAAQEMWCVTSEDDRASWARCEGKLWVELETAQAYLDPVDRSTTAGGVHFDLSAVGCAELVSTEQMRFATFTESEDADGAKTLSFSQFASAHDVACTLLWSAGAQSSTRPGRTVVTLPSNVGPIQLVGPLFVREGETLTLQSSGSSTQLQLGEATLHVGRGGKLALIQINVTDSVGGSAIFAAGEVVFVNTTVERCTATANLVLRSQDQLPIPKGSDDRPPTKGAFLVSAGGAVLVWLNSAAVTATGAIFERNTVSGSGIANWGGAIAAIGGNVALKDTIVRQCAATGGYVAWGGFFLQVFGQTDILRSSLTGNTASQSAGISAQGGAFLLLGSTAAVRFCVIDSNSAYGGGDLAMGGGIFLNAGANLALTASSVTRNQVRVARITTGGGINSAPGALLRVETTLFQENLATGGDKSRGGALAVSGRCVVLDDVVFRENSVWGTSAHGGAVAVTKSVPKAGFISEFAAVFVLCKAEGNGARGGALFVEDAEEVRLRGSVFDSNSVRVGILADYDESGSGGGIHVESGPFFLENGTLTRNMALMESLGHDATGGGLSIRDAGRVTIVNTSFASNAAGGVGLYERTVGEGAAERVIRGRAQRAAHIAAQGTVTLEHCSLFASAAPFENAAVWWLVGVGGSSAIVLTNTLLQGTTRSAGVLNLLDGATAVLRSCTGLNISFSDTILDGKLGIVNSVFEPSLNQSVNSIRPPNCAVAIATAAPLCDPVALCRGRGSGGVDCQCVGDGISARAGQPDDGSVCFQTATLAAQVVAQELRIVVRKPGSSESSFKLQVDARGDSAFSGTFRFNSRLFRLNGTSSELSERFDSPFGCTIEWLSPNPPSEELFALDKAKQKLADTKQYEVRVRLNCNLSSVIACPGDGDVIEIETSVVVSSGEPIAPATVKLTIEVEALPSCQRSSANLLASNRRGVEDTSALAVKVTIADSSAMPIFKSRPTVTMRWNMANQSIEVLPQSEGLPTALEVPMPYEFSAHPGSYRLRIALLEGWDEASQIVRECILIDQPIVVEASFATAWVLGGASAATILCVGALLVVLQRKYKAFGAILIMLLTEAAELAGSIGLELIGLGSNSIATYRAVRSLTFQDGFRLAYLVLMSLSVLGSLTCIAHLLRNARAVRSHLRESVLVSENDAPSVSDAKQQFQRFSWELKQTYRNFVQQGLVLLSLFTQGNSSLCPLAFEARVIVPS